MKKIKNIYITLIVIVGVILCCQIYNHHIAPIEIIPENGTYEELVEGFEEVKPNDLIKTINKKESGIYYIGKENCPWCQKLLPVLQPINESYQLHIQYIDTNQYKKDNVPTQEYKDLQEALKSVLDEDQTLYVPFLVKIDNGKIVSTHVGTLDSDTSRATTLSKEEQRELISVLKECLQLR